MGKYFTGGGAMLKAVIKDRRGQRRTIHSDAYSLEDIYEVLSEWGYEDVSFEERQDDLFEGKKWYGVYEKGQEVAEVFIYSEDLRVRNVRDFLMVIREDELQFYAEVDEEALSRLKTTEEAEALMRSLLEWVLEQSEFAVLSHSIKDYRLMDNLGSIVIVLNIQPLENDFVRVFRKDRDGYTVCVFEVRDEGLSYIHSTFQEIDIRDLFNPPLQLPLLPVIPVEEG